DRGMIRGEVHDENAWALGGVAGHAGLFSTGRDLSVFCGRTLTDGGELKLLRCDDCPSDMDEGLYERLRAWREVQAKRTGQPAFCVFTDRTLVAIAESAPEEPGDLARIPGVGQRKLNRYGTDVLAICAGQDRTEEEGAD
ncbi:HRDC domain-containing protein, partial [Streptomyces sp. S6]